MKPINYLIRNIPADLWQAAKHAAVDRKITLRELILEAVKNDIAPHF